MKWLIAFTGFAFVMMLGAIVLGQSLPVVEPSELPAVFDNLIKAIEGSGHWILGVNAGLMIITFILGTTVGKKIPAKYMVWVAIVIGAGLNFTASVMAGRVWWQAMLNALIGGVVMGTSAGGLWSAGGKKLSAIKSKKGDE